MLKSLHIRNWALAENLQINFRPHLNILTGETGAGKSILVGAIAAVLGGRTFSEVVRTGFESAHVEAIFNISSLPQVKNLLQKKGLAVQDELFLRRDISLKSSSRAFINDTPVTMATLAEAGDLLLDIHGQHEHQSLLRKETHRRFIDALGQLAPYLEAVAEAFSTVKSVEKSLSDLQRKQRELSEKQELFQFQYEEIEKAALTPGEEDRLKEEQKRLANMEKLFEYSENLHNLFEGDEQNVLQGIGLIDQQFTQLTQYAGDLKKLYDEFASAKIVLEETARSIEEFRNQLEFDPQRLEELESRLDLISRLKKKYGATIEEILEYQAELKESLVLSENFEFEIAKLNEQYSTALSVYQQAVVELSNRRKDVARKMESLVQEQLQLLGMPTIRFKVWIEKLEDANGIFTEDGRTYYADELGVDQMEFYISPNPGEDFKPLNRIASGGEISRIMLALKSILAEIDEVPVLIFDEIDMGVSGRIAQSVGRSIHSLSKSHQILCITHLAQIASYGEAHFSVEKYVENGRTFTQIIPLGEDQRVEAVARLMAGEHLTENVIQSARQLIAEGRED